MMNNYREKVQRFIFLFTGIFVIAFSLYVCNFVYQSIRGNYFSFSLLTTYYVSSLLVYAYITFLTGYNRSFYFRSAYKEAFIVLQIAIIIASMLILILFWINKFEGSKRLFVALFACTFFCFELLLRILLKCFLSKVFNNSKFSKKILIVADQVSYKNIALRLIRNLDWSKKACGICLPKAEDFDETIDNNGVNYVCNHSELLEYLTHNNIDEVYVFDSILETDSNMKNVLSKAEQMGIRVNISINLDFFDYLPKSSNRVNKIGPFYFLSVSRNYISTLNIISKVVLDYLGGFVGFLIFCCVYIILGPIIKLDSKGPIIFAQNRVGRNGRIFKCYKFRSMKSNAEELKKELMAKNEVEGLMFKMENDPRVTRVGKFIRKTSLDELPQFINVLKGDMSLVGTRPPTVDEYEKYEPKHKARVSMTPGLTGLWQVSGRSEIKDFDEVVKLDMQYIDNWTIWLDIKIILLTIKVVLWGKGAK